MQPRRKVSLASKPKVLSPPSVASSTPRHLVSVHPDVRVKETHSLIWERRGQEDFLLLWGGDVDDEGSNGDGHLSKIEWKRTKGVVPVAALSRHGGHIFDSRLPDSHRWIS